jgi:hypothetical protein
MQAAIRSAAIAHPLLSICIATAMVCSAVWLFRAAYPSDRAVPISAALSRSGDFSIIFRDHPGQTTSPACGCFHHDPPGGWRGIVFPAPSLTISLQSPSPHFGPAKYNLIDPSTGQFSDVPWNFALAFDTYVARVPASRRLTVRDLEHPIASHLLTSNDFAISDVQDGLSLVARGPLHVISSGIAPYAALIPPYRAATSVNYLADPEGLSLRSEFSPVPSANGSLDDNEPALDILGARKLLWADVTGIKWPISFSALNLYGASPMASGQVRFSKVGGEVVLAKIPQQKEKRFRYIAVVRVVNDFALRIIGSRGSVADGFGAIPRGMPGSMDVVMHGAESKSVREELTRAARAGIVKRYDLWSFRVLNGNRVPTQTIRKRYRRVGFTFRFPPVPPADDVNVFGAVSDLTLADGQGSVTIGSTPESFGAPTPFTFQNITGQGVIDHRFFVPMQLSRSGARIEVQGSADTRINGVPIAASPGVVSRALGDDRVMLVAGVGTLLSALVGAAQVKVNKRRPKRRRRR